MLILKGDDDKRQTGFVFFILFAVPFYDDNSLEASSRRDNHKEVTSFEAPYSSNGYEPANSSKCLLIYAFDQRRTTSKQPKVELCVLCELCRNNSKTKDLRTAHCTVIPNGSNFVLIELLANIFG